jgi:hypothetical protein
MSLMTPCNVDIIRRGELQLKYNISNKVLKVKIPEDFTVKTEEIEIEDERLKSVWGNKLYRILLIPEQHKQKDQWELRFIQ